MELSRAMERHGAWLFRWRSVLPVVAAVVIVGSVVVHEVYFEPAPEPAPTRLEEFGWLLLGIVGAAVRVGVAGYVPKRTSGRNTEKGQVADSLNTSGLYSVVRHPLYFGNFLLWVSCVGVGGGPDAAMVMALLFLLAYERVMLVEESFLRERFGEAFEAWAARTPAFLPRPGLWVPSVMAFCARTALKREYTSILSYLACFAVLANVARATAALRLKLDELWLITLVAAACAYVVLRVLRKRRVFSVAGR